MHANCDFVAYSKESHVLAGGSSRTPVEALAIHAMRDIAAGEELTLTYGASYQPFRNYECGEPPESRVTQKEIIDMGETPAYWLGDTVRRPDMWKSY